MIGVLLQDEIAFGYRIRDASREIRTWTEVRDVVYITREQALALGEALRRNVYGTVQPQSDYWYYCRESEGYYPYVKDCPSDWVQVAPQPPPQ